MKWLSIVLCFSLMFGCVKDRNFEAPESDSCVDLVANTTYLEVKNLFQESTIQIQDDLIIEGFVNSSDEMGNFFSVLHFQDRAENPTEGFQIEIDLRDSHLFYPSGSKIFIKLKGLYLGKSKDVFKLGATFPSFGNLFIGRLPKTVIADHIIVACDNPVSIMPQKTTITALEKRLTNTLISLEDVEIIEKELGLLFAEVREETERTLVDCDGNEIVLLNSGFSDFQVTPLPSGNGTITGVLLRERENFQLVIRDLQDILLLETRCSGID